MIKKKFLAFDTETGGVDPNKNPILTAYFAVVAEDFGIVDELYLQIRPEAPFDLVEPEALNANKIDLKKLMEHSDTVSRIEAGRRFLDFLKRHQPSRKENSNQTTKLRPLGHNVDFDINMLKAQIIGPDDWEKHLHYSKIDTKMITDFLKDAGWLPPELGNLTSLVKHFDVQMLGAHEAKNDTIMVVEVYKKIVDLLANKRDNSNATPFDVLSLLEK